MVQRLSARVADLRLGGTRALVAFSGGSDSTALAIAMSELRRAGRVRPALAHVEHRVRPDAGSDLATVLATAERLGLPVSIRAIPDGGIAGHIGTGPEEAMRRERYLVLSRVAVESGSAALLTAHHADDQAETVLGHLIRGAGLAGATGICPDARLRVPWWGSEAAAETVRVVRPMLAERRADLRSLVDQHGLAVVDDPTNRDLDQTRAALRHLALPLLESIHAGASAALTRFAELAADAVDAQVQTLPPDGSPILDIASFNALPVTAQRRAVRSFVTAHRAAALTFERTEAVRRWLMSGGSGSVEIGGGWSIRRAGRTIELHMDDRDRRDEPT